MVSQLLLPISARKAPSFGITYVLTHEYTYDTVYPLLFMAIISPYDRYSMAIATLLVGLSLCYWIPLYNELMITSRPKVVIIPLLDTTILRLLHSYIASYT